MYAWGGSTADWTNSGSYDFGSARAKYANAAKAAGATGPRNYTRRGSPDMALVNPQGKTISTNSTDPVIIAVDVTGSMNTWPGEIFDRLPLLYETLAKYRDGVEFAFAAIGDATCDSYPLQVTDFTKDIKDLEARLKALGCEGGGGGQTMESYELFGYFMANHCKTPNALSPFLLIYGDEGFYNEVNAKQVKHYIGDKLQAGLPARDVWKDVTQRCATYLLHKPYNEGSSPDIDKRVTAQWAEALGNKQRIIELPNAERAVDIGMGLIAKHWGEYGDFSKNLNARQKSSRIKASVHQSLRHIDTNPGAKSVITRASRLLPAPFT